MTTLAEIAEGAGRHALAVSGAFHPGPDDALPEGTGTLILLSPAEPGFWAHLAASAEWADGKADALDRWSRRVIGRMACDLAAKAHFPFGGPPYRPFHAWALRSGRAWTSPVSLLVHDTMGLLASYRGALALPETLALPSVNQPRPCETCAGRPCLTACPVGALTGAGYDLDACHGFLDTPRGDSCLLQGCAVRRACPVSQNYGRVNEQSAYHMRHFHP